MKQSDLRGRSGRRFLHGFFPLFAAALTAIAPAALAQQKPISILITASRFAETADRALAPVSVITRDDIEEMQANTVEDVLRTVPGISITRSGGTGQLSSLFLRGTESNHVLLLLDGVKIGNATNGLPPFRDLSLEQIEKIEVVRGPRSSLYGSEAIGGVIQIFTRRDRGKRTTVDLAAGSHKTAKSGVGVSGGGERGWYRLGASASSTQGFNACRGSTSPFAGCFLPENNLEDDRDKHTNRSVSFRAGGSAGRFSIESALLSSDNELEFDGSFQNESLTSTRTGRIKLDARAARFWNSSLSFGQSQDLSDNFNDGEYISTFDTLRNQASWQNDFALGERHRIIAGVDYLEDRVESTTNYVVKSRENTAAFASWRVDAGFFDAEVSARNDDNEQFGDHSTGGIAWGANIGDAHRVTVFYGTGFAAPTFNDLYWPRSGNPDLEPEESESIDVGFSGRDFGVNWALNMFRTQIDNQIALDSAFRPVNVDVAVIRGLELSGGLAFGRWNFQANMTAQEPKTGVGRNAGKRLARRAKTIFNFDASRAFGAFSLGASTHAQSSSFDDAANTRRLNGFATADLRGELRLRGNWTLALRVNNIFDKQYETVAYYPQDGTNFLLTLRHASTAR
ncbi:MAG: TonB-dependent receptor [Gammaproteobacteria bacterium]|nr:TonB-dependent receptor [Gammaproteobacteria bacterium]